MTPQIPVVWPDVTKLALDYLRTAYPATYPDLDAVTFSRSRPETTAPSRLVSLVAVPQGRATLISRTFSLVIEAAVVDGDGVDDVGEAYNVGARVLAVLQAWPSSNGKVVAVSDGTGPTPAREAASQREFQELTSVIEVQR